MVVLTQVYGRQLTLMRHDDETRCGGRDQLVCPHRTADWMLETGETVQDGARESTAEQRHDNFTLHG